MKRVSPKPHVPKFAAIVEAKRRSAEKTVRDWLAEYVEHHRRRFQNWIYDQRFDAFHLIPLSEKWLETKEMAGADLRTMIATGHYVASMRVFKEKQDDGTLMFRVGFAETDVAIDLDGEPTDFPLWRLARVQELGSAAANVPARPHWTPYWAEIRRDVPGQLVRLRRRVYRNAKAAKPKRSSK